MFHGKRALTCDDPVIMNKWSDITRATNAQILAWAEAQPWAREMAACQQDAQWHAEGDVWMHTRVDCAELERLADWPSLDRAAQLKLLFTALFHDVGKPAPWLSNLGGGTAYAAGSGRGFARVAGYGA